MSAFWRTLRQQLLPGWYGTLYMLRTWQLPAHADPLRFDDCACTYCTRRPT